MIRTGATSLRLAHSDERPASDNRLAELVAHLTGCGPRAAVRAIDDALPDDHDHHLSVDERLGVVARALVVVQHEQLDLRSRRPA